MGPAGHCLFYEAQDLAKEMPDQVAKMKQIFLMEATANKALS